MLNGRNFSWAVFPLCLQHHNIGSCYAFSIFYSLTSFFLILFLFKTFFSLNLALILIKLHSTFSSHFPNSINVLLILILWKSLRCLNSLILFTSVSTRGHLFSLFHHTDHQWNYWRQLNPQTSAKLNWDILLFW